MYKYIGQIKVNTKLIPQALGHSITGLNLASYSFIKNPEVKYLPKPPIIKLLPKPKITFMIDI